MARTKGLNVHVEAQGLEAAIAAVEASDAQIRRAGRRALVQATRFAASQAARAIARRHRVPLKALTQGGSTGRGRRVIAHPPTDQRPDGRVWVGIDPVLAAYVGSPRQTAAGARSGRHFFERAFVATMLSGHRGVYRRDVSHRRYRRVPRPNVWGSSQLPLKEQTVPLDEAPAIVGALRGRVSSRLATLFERALERETGGIAGGAG
jgi:hypothetical protein